MSRKMLCRMKIYDTNSFDTCISHHHIYDDNPKYYFQASHLLMNIQSYLYQTSFEESVQIQSLRKRPICLSTGNLLLPWLSNLYNNWFVRFLYFDSCQTRLMHQLSSTYIQKGETGQSGVDRKPALIVGEVCISRTKSHDGMRQYSHVEVSARFLMLLVMILTTPEYPCPIYSKGTLFETSPCRS